MLGINWGYNLFTFDELNKEIKIKKINKPNKIPIRGSIWNPLPENR
jgi:hypothetical protein